MNIRKCNIFNLTKKGRNITEKKGKNFAKMYDNATKGSTAFENLIKEISDFNNCKKEISDEQMYELIVFYLQIRGVVNSFKNTLDGLQVKFADIRIYKDL